MTHTHTHQQFTFSQYTSSTQQKWSKSISLARTPNLFIVLVWFSCINFKKSYFFQFCWVPAEWNMQDWEGKRCKHWERKTIWTWWWCHKQQDHHQIDIDCDTNCGGLHQPCHPLPSSPLLPCSHLIDHDHVSLACILVSLSLSLCVCVSLMKLSIHMCPLAWFVFSLPQAICDARVSLFG